MSLTTKDIEKDKMERQEGNIEIWLLSEGGPLILTQFWFQQEQMQACAL